MATVTQKICDRCGKPIEYVGWTSKIRNALRKGKTVKIHELLNGNPDGYSYLDNQYELCRDCTKQLEKFLMNKKAMPDNAVRRG